MRQTVAVGAGKLTRQLSRWSGRGGSTLPGRVVLALEPDFLRRMAAQVGTGSLLVTGTNGKTTTANLLAGMLRRGHRVCHNAAGANLLVGLTTAFLTECDPWGRLRAELAVLEVDEATMPRAAAELSPVGGVVTNFFRDQLDRYGELDTTVALVSRGLAALPAGAVAVLNADDPLTASLAGCDHLTRVRFGCDPAALADVPARGAAPSDAPRCPRCGGELLYAHRFYAQLGEYRCARCGFARPRPEVLVTAWLPGGAGRAGEVTLRVPGGELTFPLALPGLYNVYNAAAAVAAALGVGTALDDVVGALAGFRHAFGRMEWLDIAGHPACLALVKNPTGCSSVLQAVTADPAPGKALVLLLNDRYADGTDVSWIWDADFEALAAEQAGFAVVVAGGRRAADMALRCKYAGVAAERLRVRAEPQRALALALAAATPGASVYVLPTYTAMLEARAALVRQGRLQPFWEVSGQG